MHWSCHTGFMKFDNEHDLIFNNISGHIDLLQSGQLSLLREIELATLDEETRNYLSTRGYLTDKTEEEEEREYEEEGFRKFRKSQINKQHVIVITYDCNLRCEYCYEKNLQANGKEWIQKRLTKDMVDQIYQAIDYFKSQGDDQSNNITLFGGEPLLPDNKEIVEYILQEGEKRERKFTIVTNGTTLDVYLDLLLKYPVDTIQITIDGVKEVHDKRRYASDGSGTFDTIIRNLQLLLAQKDIKIDIKVVVDEGNSHGLEDLTKYLEEIGLTNKPHVRAYAAPIFSKEPSMKNLRHEIMQEILNFHQQQKEELWEDGMTRYHPLDEVVRTGKWKPKYSYCSAHQGLLMYDPMGNMYCCWESVGESNQIVGSYTPQLKMNSSYEIWQNRMVLKLEKCRKCKVALFCGGGCAYNSFLTQGSIEKENCSEMEIILNQFMPYLSREVGK